MRPAVHNQVPEARASITARAYSSLASCPAVNTRADRRGGTRDGRRVHGVAPAAALGVDGREGTVPMVG